MTARIDRTVTSGTFSLDGQTYDVDNNVWVLGDDDECVVIDAPHDIEAILGLVGTRKVVAVVAIPAFVAAGGLMINRDVAYLSLIHI